MSYFVFLSIAEAKSRFQLAQLSLVQSFHGDSGQPLPFDWASAALNSATEFSRCAGRAHTATPGERAIDSG